MPFLINKFTFQRAKFLCSSETYQNEKLEWANLFEISRKTLRVTPTFSYMCGYDVTKTASENRKERKIRERKENKNEQVTTKQPEKIADLRREEDSVDDTVKFILWALNKEYKNNNSKPINYFKFTMEPESYSQSVENCFHLSFLIRDGRVHFIKGKLLNVKLIVFVIFIINIFTDESGMLVISPVSHKHSRAEINLPFQQYIVSLDTSLWKVSCITFYQS